MYLTLFIFFSLVCRYLHWVTHPTSPCRPFPLLFSVLIELLLCYKMSKVTKELFCPICKSSITCEASSSSSIALRSHRNKSIYCKELILQKRLRNEISSSDRAEKQPKVIDEQELFKTSRDPSPSSNAHYSSSGSG